MDVIETGNTEIVAGDAGQQAKDAGNKDATAGGQQDTTQDAAGSQSDEVAGLKAAAAAERVKRQDVEAQNVQLQQQMSVANANQSVDTQQAAPTSMFMQAAKFHGFDPEFMTPAETGQVMDTLMQFMAQGQQNATFDASHSDFKDIVGSVVNGVFVESPHLLKVYESNPGLRQAFSGLGLSANTKLIAYQMVKNSPEYQATIKTEGLSDEQKAAVDATAKIAAANKTASISSVQGGGNLDRGAALAGMTDVEFKQELDKKMAEAN